MKFAHILYLRIEVHFFRFQWEIKCNGSRDEALLKDLQVAHCIFINYDLDNLV